MALEPEWSMDQGQYVLAGVARDPDVTAPLGRQYFSFPPSPSPPAHVIGFDDNFAEPVIMRAYYDPMADPVMASLARKAVMIGYVQIMQIKFRGTLPIPPSVYGGRLADRQVYEFGGEHEFIDLMGPGSAKLLNVTMPLYPYNAMLMDGNVLRTYDPADGPTNDLRQEVLQANYPFFAAGLENGSLYSYSDYSGPLARVGKSQSVVASIAAEIAPSLTTPADVAPVLDANHLLATYRPTRVDLGSREPYQYALEQLRTKPLPGDDQPWLTGIANSDIAAEVIGNFVLLTMPDTDDDSGSTLVITTDRDSIGPAVLVFELLPDDVKSLMFYQAKELFWRIWEFQTKTGRKADEEMGTSPPEDEMSDVVDLGTRGSGGLLTPPFQIDPDKPVIELCYRTIPVAYHVQRDKQRNEFLVSLPHRGIQWSALLTYDEISGDLTVSSIGQPQRLRSYKTQDALRRFTAALKDKDAGKQFVDLSNFTKAAMRRDNFAAGLKVGIVGRTGEEFFT
jgi:hypothetical protein